MGLADFYIWSECLLGDLPQIIIIWKNDLILALLLGCIHEQVRLAKQGLKIMRTFGEGQTDAHGEPME